MMVMTVMMMVVVVIHQIELVRYPHQRVVDPKVGSNPQLVE